MSLAAGKHFLFNESNVRLRYLGDGEVETNTTPSLTKHKWKRRVPASRFGAIIKASEDDRKGIATDILDCQCKFLMSSCNLLK